mgnify:CR=1 FL=1
MSPDRAALAPQRKRTNDGTNDVEAARRRAEALQATGATSVATPSDSGPQGTLPALGATQDALPDATQHREQVMGQPGKAGGRRDRGGDGWSAQEPGRETARRPSKGTKRGVAGGPAWLREDASFGELAFEEGGSGEARVGKKKKRAR